MAAKTYNWQIRLWQSVSIITLSVLLVTPMKVAAGDHWLSGVTIKDPSQSAITRQASKAALMGLAGVMSTSSDAVFDITISLDSNPQGDDNYKKDSGTSDAEQKAYEKRIEEFAKAVYQSTNGANKIRKVTLFRTKSGGKRVDSADVLWDENCNANAGPRANISGFGVAGMHIWMCTNWSGASTLMPSAKGAGYTLAHEWGHYTYGLFDEYALEQCPLWKQILHICPLSTPRGTDTAAIPAIMNNQWNAASGNVPSGYTGSATDFLEHSTQNIDPHRSDSKGANAQKRVYGASAWQTLTRDPATDPKYSWLPIRTQYTVLSAPTDPNWIVNNDESTALSELDIRWVGNQVLELLLDRSGSMSGTPLANAKTGANLLIDQLQSGTAIGVSSFETSVARNFPITDIPSPEAGVKSTAKAAVNALSTAGVTSMYDGLMSSLNSIKAFDPNRPGLVYVLSDGGDNNSSATEANVISAYKAAGVPIIAFAYGSYAPTGTLLRMANATSGAFYQSPTTVSQIQAALLAADAQFSSNVLVSSAQSSAPASATTFRTITLDSTLASARINLAYSGSQSDFNFNLLLPSGTASGVPFVCQGAASCSATLDKAFFDIHGYGNYQIEMFNKTGAQKDVTVLVSATPTNIETYNISVSFSKDTIVYPNDMIIRATVSKGPSVAGLDVVAKATDQTGNTFDIILLDDGKGSDQIAHDGTYSASVPYATNGIYSFVITASNAAGNAQTTYEGQSVSLREDGTAVTPTTMPITENFVRVGTATTSVSGILPDDHANNPTGGACTRISDNNIDVSGRIDYAGDIDCFTFVPSSLSKPIVVRATSLSSGIDPVLTVYNHTGTVQIAQIDMTTTESPASGATVTITAAKLDAAGIIFVVRHKDQFATTGSYKVSAGASLASDLQPPVAIPGGPYGGFVGKPITFDASASYDPDGSIVKYEWDWNNDGAYDQTTTIPVVTHNYNPLYVGSVGLRVTDNHGATGTATAKVSALSYGSAKGSGTLADGDFYRLDTTVTGGVLTGKVEYYAKGSPSLISTKLTSYLVANGVKGKEITINGEGVVNGKPGKFTLKVAANNAVEVKMTDLAGTVLFTKTAPSTQVKGYVQIIVQ